MDNKTSNLKNPRGERRCHVGNDANGNVFEPFVRAAWADAEIERLRIEVDKYDSAIAQRDLQIERLRAALEEAACVLDSEAPVAAHRARKALSGDSPAVETTPDPLDYKLPCEVRIPPSTSFGKGVTLRALMHGLRSRECQPDEVTRFHDERAKAIRNALRFTDASLEKLCQCDPGPAFGQVCNTCGGIKGFTQETGRDPPPPDVLAGALQDVVHTDTGQVRAGRSVKALEQECRRAGLSENAAGTGPVDTAAEARSSRREVTAQSCERGGAHDPNANGECVKCGEYPCLSNGRGDV